MVGKKVGQKVKIGVLALQGAVAEHIRMLNKAGAEGVIIKKVEQLEHIQGLIIPGGESTTIGKLIREYGFMEPLRSVAKNGFPLWGTCAGMIVLAKTIKGSDQHHLGLMDMTVERNAFGRQRDSFETDLVLKEVADDFRAVFIRAPLVTEIGNEVEILAHYKEDIVAVRQGHIIATSFHPELTDDERLHHFFVKLAKEYLSNKTLTTR